MPENTSTPTGRVATFYALSCGHVGRSIYKQIEQDGKPGYEFEDGQRFFHFGCSDCGKLASITNIQPLRPTK